MKPTPKQALQRTRSFLKYQLTGRAIRANHVHLSAQEVELINKIEATRRKLLEIHDKTSKRLGLNIGYERTKEEIDKAVEELPEQPIYRCLEELEAGLGLKRWFLSDRHAHYWQTKEEAKENLYKILIL